MPVRDITFADSVNMKPVQIDLSKYIIEPLPGTGPVTYSGGGATTYASFHISGSIATITPLPAPGTSTFQFIVQQGTYQATGNVKVTVYDFKGIPGLVNPYQFPTCFDYMGAVNFSSGIRYLTNFVGSSVPSEWSGGSRINGTNEHSYYIHGLIVPLVGDLNGDGYPEIVVIGKRHDYNPVPFGLNSEYQYLDAYDGRTGKAVVHYRFAGETDYAHQHAGWHSSPGDFVLIDADRNGSKEVIIAFPNSGNGMTDLRGYVVSYEISKDNFSVKRKWKSTDKWYNGGYAGHPILQVVDFDGDGNAEILLYNRIYNAATGALLMQLQTLNAGALEPPTGSAYTGRNNGNIYEYDDQMGLAYIYDVDLDGRYDVVAGGKVYYDIRPTSGSYKTLHFTGVRDGRTAVADMDCDGIPDIVVAIRPSDGSPVHLYVWDPGFLKIQNNQVVKNYTQDSQGRNTSTSFTPKMITDRDVNIGVGAGSFSYIFIGDIDGKVQTVGSKEYRLPEVAFIGGKYTYAPTGKAKDDYHPNVLIYNSAKPSDPPTSLIPSNGGTSAGAGVLAAFTMDMNDAKKLKLSFILGHNDTSVSTGFTMFDFDNDGIQEICYRDEATLRIIKANKSYIAHDEGPGSSVMLRVPCISYTGYEYPAIADVDNDNSAEIIVIGRNSGPTDHGYGYVYVVGNGGSDKFAPAWPVWNQFMYDPFKIKPDSITTPLGLAINRLDPKYNFVREIKDVNGVVTKTLTDFNPYNGTLRQATKLDAQAIPKYEPIVFLTEAYIISGSTNSQKPKIVSSSNNHYIELTIGNKPTSKTNLSHNTPIAVYNKNTISQATQTKFLTLRQLYSQGTTTALGSTFSLAPGQTKTVWIPIGSGPVPGAGAAIVGDVYIVRVGDDSKIINSTWTWQFGYNGGEKYGDEYPCDDFAEGLGTASRAFRDCDWCDQVVRAARYQIFPDLYTIQEFTDVTMDILGNDILPNVPLANLTSKTFMDTVKLSAWNIITPPKAGYLSFNNVEGAGARVTYHHDDRGDTPANIDSFQYQLKYFDDVKPGDETKTGTVYIYLLKSATGGFSSCYGKSTRIELQNLPANVNFEWYKTRTSNVKLQNNARFRLTGEMKGDSTYWIKPVTSSVSATTGVTAAQIAQYKTLNFPRGEIKVRLVSYQPNFTPTMRWTGHVDNKWRNPRNWVQVRPAVGSGKPQESPVEFSPSECTDVIINADVNHFPELTDTAICNNIYLKDRAMLRNPHVLKYVDAMVEMKLKPSERDRFVMWSAPLTSMYSGDYHFRDASGPRWGDVFMNMFQMANPQGGTAVVNHFTSTFATLGHPLELGKAFNLKVATNSKNRDSLLRFPRAEISYTAPVGSASSLSRTNSRKFITHGRALDASGVFALPVWGDIITAGNAPRLVQVVNPYMAYLSIDSFLKYNSTLLQNGYYLWDGEVGTGMTAASFTNGNRISMSNPQTSMLTKDPKLIPPLQSFFVAKSSVTTGLTTVKMSPNWTTTAPVASYMLRAATRVQSGGVLHMTLSNSNGSKTAHAAMVYTIGASSFMDREDMPAVSHNVDNEPSLSLYTFSNNNIPLVINSNEHFDMTPVTLGFIVKASGKYKLEFEHLQSFGFDVTLVDKAENYKLIDLQKTPEYTFTVTNPTPSVSQEINNRFELRFTYTGHGVTISGLENDPPSSELHLSSGRGYIQAWTSGSPIGSLEVYDALGKQIYRNADVNDHQLRIHVPSRKLYIVKAMVGGEMKIEKTIIK